MKLAAFIDNGFSDMEFYRSYVNTVLQQTGADAVAVLMAGAITHSGFLPSQSMQQRAEKLRKAGCQLVIEVPVHGVILKPDSYYYVLAMLIQKMNCVDALYLPCDAGEAAVLVQCAQTIFQSSRAYQNALTRLCRDRELDTAIAQAVGLFVPGGEAALSKPRNRFAVEMENALILSYCRTKPVVCEVDFPYIPEAMDAAADARLGSLLSEMISQMDERAIGEIFGIDTTAAKQIKTVVSGTYTDLAMQLDVPAHTARQLLLRCALNYRHISHSMCALYSYVPTIRVLAGEERCIRELTEKAAATVVYTGEALSEIEAAAYRLFELVHQQ